MAEKKCDVMSDDIADANRIARDYALMRLEYIESSDLVGYIEEDVKNIANEFHDAQRKLLSTCSKTEQRSECGVTVTFEQKFRKILSIIRQNAQSLTKSIVPEPVCAKLPKINIKPFDGRLENWVSFKQLYDSLIHSRSMPSVEKLYYLLSSVQNSAYDLIKNFPLTNESYLDAYNSLSKYYDRKRQIASSFFEKLVFCKPILSKTGSELERVSRTFTENLAVLEKYQLPDRNFMLFYLLWSKLDRLTQEAFQLEFNSDEIPEFEELQIFIQKHYRALETSGHNSSNVESKFKSKTTLITTKSPSCPFCSGQHKLCSCPEFIKCSVEARFQFVKAKILCVCCLSGGHKVRSCSSCLRCSVCNYSHHTLLHFNRPFNPSTEECTASPTIAQPSTIALASGTGVSNVLFSTARVAVRDSNGNWQTVRALMDSASAGSFMSEQCARRLGLQIINNNQVVCGIGDCSTKPNGMVSCEVRSLHDFNYKVNVETLVLPSICTPQPACPINFSKWSHIKELGLADPDFACPGPIDLLLSADIFASSLVSGLRQGCRGQPRALNTIFGWVIMGGCDVTYNNNNLAATSDCLFVSNPSLPPSNLSAKRLQALSPLRDNAGNLRVGGRLSGAHYIKCCARQPITP